MTNDITLAFGKYNGKKLSQVPTDYVRWLSEQVTICGKTIVPQVAKEFLASTKPTTERVAPSPIASSKPQTANAPRTLKEAEKMGWMAGKNYGNARSTLLAARDADGFIRVVDEDIEGNEYTLVYVRKDGTVMDGYGACQLLSKNKVLAILARYGMSDQAEHYTKFL